MHLSTLKDHCRNLPIIRLMDIIKIGMIILLLIFVSQNGYSQKPVKVENNDSLNQVYLNEYNSRLAEIQQQRVADSIQKTFLESQIKTLRTTDNLSKAALQKQLDELNEKEVRRIAIKKAGIDSLRKTAKSYPVTVFFKDTLFSIYTGLGSFSAKERADATAERIEKLAENYQFNPDSIKISESELSENISYDETIIMSISENDALWNNTSKTEMAIAYSNIIGKAIVKYKSQTSFETLLKEIGLSLVALLIICILFYCIIRLFRWTASKITNEEGKRIYGIRFRNFTIFNAKQQIDILLKINSFVKWFCILLLVYASLPVLFGIFPGTKGLASTLFNYFLDPVKKIAVGLWHYLPNLITIIVFVVIFRYVLKAFNFFKVEIEKGTLTIPGFYADWANPTFQIIRVIIFAFMVVVIFPFLPGSDSPIFKGVSVFLGFLFTFGSAGSLGNIIAGLVLTYMRLFKIGDRVKIGDVVGDVIEKSMLVTRIRTIKNEIISIPNTTVMSSPTINYSSDASDKGLIIYTTVTIGYGVPWKEMHRALIDAALKTDLVLKDPIPFVLQTALSDFYVSYQINAYIRDANQQAMIYSDLHQNIQDVCNERGIEIMSPHYTAARDGNHTTIPENYLPKEYEAPGFNFFIKKEDSGK